MVFYLSSRKDINTINMFGRGRSGDLCRLINDPADFDYRHAHFKKFYFINRIL